MKSFGKTFRTFLAMSLALCMVMSCVTVSADETKVSLTVGTPTDTPVDGYYTVTATVDGLVAGNSATILVHKEEAPTNGTIGYANQDVIAEGQTSKTFTMELKKGEYKVLAGGTGKTAAQTATLVIEGVAPAFADDAALVVAALDDKTAVEGATVVANFPEAEDADKEEVTYSIGGDNAEKFVVDSEAKTIKLTENLAAGRYHFTLVATSADGKAELAGTLVVAPTTVKVKLGEGVLVNNVYVEYGSDAEATPAFAETSLQLYKEDGSIIEGATVAITGWNKPEGYTTTLADGEESKDYEFTAILAALSSEYVWATGVAPVVKATAKVQDSRDEVIVNCETSQTVNWGALYAEPTITYTVGGTETSIEDVKVTWSGDTVNTKDDSKTYSLIATVELPADGDYRIAGTHSTTTTVNVTVTVNDNREVVTVEEYTKSFPIGYNDTYIEPAIKLLGNEGADVTALAATEAPVWTLEGDGTYSPTTEGTYTFKATITLNDGYKFVDEGGQISTEQTIKYTVVVTDDRDCITEIVTDPAIKEVGYNKVPNLGDVRAFANIDGKEAVELEFAPGSVWTYAGEGEPDMTAIGDEYTYERAVVIDENSYIYTDEEAVATVVVKVVESRKVISNVKYSVTETEVAFGTKTPAIPEGAFTADIDGVETTGNVPVVFEGDWTCDGYEAETPGEYTFTRKVVINQDQELSDEYKFDAEEVVVQVTVKVAKKDVKITGYTGFDATETFAYGEVGDYTLPAKVGVVAEGYIGEFTVTWDNEFSKEVGTVVYTGTVTVPADDATYNFDASGVEAPMITVTINYVIDCYEFLDAGKTPMDEVLYVEVGTTLEDELYEGTFPKYLVLKDGDNSIEVEISDDWWINEGFPASAWEYAYVKLSTENIVLGDNWTWGKLADSIVFATMTKGSAPFVVNVDGYNKNYVASLNDQPATVTIEGIDGDIPGLAAEKAYKFDVDGMEGEWQSEKFVNVASESGKSKHTVVATIKLQDGTTESQTRYINKYSTLFNGSVYINNTEDDGDSYSAARANKNRDIHVSHDFVFSNDVAGYNFTGTTKVEVFKVDDDELVIHRTFDFASGSKSLVIPASEVKEWDNGTYRFVVTYNSGNAIIGSKTNARYVYISNNGTWYNSFLINGLSRSGIVIRNNDQLENKIQLTELGDKGVVWIAHSLKTFGDNPKEVASRDYEAVNSKDYLYVLPLTENGELKPEFAENGTYKFYTTLKLDGKDSVIEDMNIGRVVYIYKQITAINTVAINDSCNSDAIIKDGKFEFKPNWYKEARKNEFSYNELTYKITFVSGLKADASLEDAVVTEGVEVVNGDTIIFKEAKGAETATVTVNADIFDTKVKAELVVEIDGVEDARLPRTFWPKEAE